MRESRKMMYLLAGAWNTLFGYTVGLLLYSYLSDRFHIITISVIANILAISMSYFTYKLFVFKTAGNWWPEYLRSYVVYGGSALVGTGLLWLQVDYLHIPFWLAQGLAIALTVIFSYMGHARFTFAEIRRNS
jgi:putative flippase GtrA